MPEYFIVDIDVALMIQSCMSRTARPRACGGGRERDVNDGNGSEIDDGGGGA